MSFSVRELIDAYESGDIQDVDGFIEEWEQKLQPISDLPVSGYFVVDPQTGTMIGLTAVLVPVPEDDATLDEVTSNHSAAVKYADEHGIPLIASL